MDVKVETYGRVKRNEYMFGINERGASCGCSPWDICLPMWQGIA